MKSYIPNTPNVNKDRRYFVKENIFIKQDFNIQRGENEAKILSSLSHPYIQKYKNSYVKNNSHFLETEYFPHETLENLTCSSNEILLIKSQLLQVLSYTVTKQIVHNDINVSNVLFNGDHILLIDWESSYLGDTIQDLIGPPTVTNHCGVINVLNNIKVYE